MANQIATVNGIAIANIANLNGITDANLAKLNGREFTSALPDAHTLIATATASGSSTLSFTSGIDSTYDEYEFRFEDMHPATDGVKFQFQVNATGQTGFNEYITSTYYEAYQAGGSGTGVTSLLYKTANDSASSTAYQPLTDDTGNENYSSASGVLTLYAPSSTTYMKHFLARVGSRPLESPSLVAQLKDSFAAGYFHTTNAIDEISFKFSSGNMDAGRIKMYGVAKS